MANIIFTEDEAHISGKFGDKVYYVRNGKNYCRKLGKINDPKTPAQQNQRSAMKMAVDAWKELDAAGKEQYNERARKENRYGYHLFIEEYMRTQKQL